MTRKPKAQPKREAAGAWAALSPEAVAARERRKEAFRKNVWRLMLKAGMTQSDLSRAAGLGRDSISGYVLGRNLPTPASAQAIATALGATTEDLYAGAVDLPPENPSDLVFEELPSGMVRLQVRKTVPFATAVEVVRLLTGSQK
jgi:transcriptional regulator with XRE-family HTH domain